MEERFKKRNRLLLYLEGFFIMLGGGMVQIGTTLTYILTYLIPKQPIVIGLMHTIVALCVVLPKFFASRLILSKEKDSPIMARIELIKGLLWILLGIVIYKVEDKNIAAILMLVILAVIFMTIGANTTIRTDIIGKVVSSKSRGKFLGNKEFISRMGGIIAAVIGGFILASFPKPLNFAVLFWSVGFIQAFSYFVLINIREKGIIREKKQQPMKKFMSSAMKILSRDKNLIYLIVQDNFKVLGITITGMYVIYLKDKINIDGTDMMIFTGCIMLGIGIFSPIIGKISDKKGCKYVLRISYILYILSYFSMFFVVDKWIVYLNYFIIGVASTSDIITKDNIAIMLGKENNRSLYETMRSTFILPMSIISPILIAVLITFFGFNITLLIEVVFMSLAFLTLNNKVNLEENSEVECNKNVTVY
ncbi:MAG TPA: hypothetical protein DCP90_06435 [Clostridiales bacterium]|nr:MAG: hypothetical protein A2Y22_00840 [Clostridiales bacterium GWD2_32_59]HAN10232.1 hypothetical protein [Clostridiales bacterium]